MFEFLFSLFRKKKPETRKVDFAKTPKVNLASQRPATKSAPTAKSRPAGDSHRDDYLNNPAHPLHPYNTLHQTVDASPPRREESCSPSPSRSSDWGDSSPSRSSDWGDSSPSRSYDSGSCSSSSSSDSSSCSSSSSGCD